jgi:hypothetical protein
VSKRLTRRTETIVLIFFGAVKALGAVISSSGDAAKGFARSRHGRFGTLFASGQRVAVVCKNKSRNETKCNDGTMRFSVIALRSIPSFVLIVKK